MCHISVSHQGYALVLGGSAVSCVVTAARSFRMTQALRPLSGSVWRARRAELAGLTEYQSRPRDSNRQPTDQESGTRPGPSSRRRPVALRLPLSLAALYRPNPGWSIQWLMNQCRTLARSAMLLVRKTGMTAQTGISEVRGGGYAACAITRPTSRRDAPSVNSDLTSRSRETEASAASIFATRD